MSENQSVLNSLFIDAVGSQDGLEKLASVGGAYVQQKLRETSFARQILPPINVGRDDVQRAVDHNGFQKIIDKEPESKAMAMNFQGEPDGRYITGARYAVDFYRIASEDFSSDETELLSYEYPITKVIEENSIKDIQRIEDEGFFKHVNAGIVEGQSHINVGGTNNKLTKEAIEALINIIDGRELKTDCLLMRKTTFNNILSWDHTLLGDDMIQKVTLDGYTYNTLFGLKIITSNKERMFERNAVFTAGGTQLVEAVTGQAGAATVTVADSATLAAGDTVTIATGANAGFSGVIVSVDSATQVTLDSALVAEAGAADYTFVAQALPTIYGFTAPNFLGQFYILNQTKFVIKKDYNIVSFRAWEDIGIGIGNLNAMSAITLG